jgi:hypothetical protein
LARVDHPEHFAVRSVQCNIRAELLEHARTHGLQVDLSGPDFAPVLLQDGVDCNGDEAALADCDMRPHVDTYFHDGYFTGSDCSHYADAVVACADTIDASALLISLPPAGAT